MIGETVIRLIIRLWNGLGLIQPLRQMLMWTQHTDPTPVVIMPRLSTESKEDYQGHLCEGTGNNKLLEEGV